MAEKFSEAALYPPLREYFTGLGYEVFSEVDHCDVVAKKEGFVLVIEIKKSFNMTLLYQAIDRQRFADGVYMAVPKPKGRNKHMGKDRHIAQSLGLGLIYVSMAGPVKYLDVLCEPALNGKEKNNARKRYVVKELSGRSLDLNQGGMNNRKIATAYREKCIQVACILKKEGQMAPKDFVKHYGFEPSVAALLQMNHYGWFDRIRKGVYTLSDQALYDMENGHFKPLFQLYMEKYPSEQPTEQP